MGQIRDVNFLEELQLKLKWIIERERLPDRGQWIYTFTNTVIWIIVKGERLFHIGGQPVRLKQGDIAVIPPNVIRYPGPAAEEDAPFHYISAGCDIRLGSLEVVDIYQFPVSAHVGDTPGFTRLVDMSQQLQRESEAILSRLDLKGYKRKEAPLLAKLRHVNADETMELLALNSLFHTWFFQLFRLLRPSLPASPVPVDTRVRRVCAYIRNHLDRKLHVEELAKLIHVSESHLRVLFRHTLRLSPSEYWQRERLKRTKELLLNTELSLKEISERVGFQSQSMFSRAFLKLEKMSAREYRRRYK